jgi:hypothetical protein
MEHKKMTTDTPRTDAERNKAFCNLRTDYEAYAYMANHAETLESELAASKAEVERLRDALKSCFWATNTYDGNYARACDNVEIIVTNALNPQDNPTDK